MTRINGRRMPAPTTIELTDSEDYCSWRCDDLPAHLEISTIDEARDLERELVGELETIYQDASAASIARRTEIREALDVIDAVVGVCIHHACADRDDAANHALCEANELVEKIDLATWTFLTHQGGDVEVQYAIGIDGLLDATLPPRDFSVGFACRWDGNHRLVVSSAGGSEMEILVLPDTFEPMFDGREHRLTIEDWHAVVALLDDRNHLEFVNVMLTDAGEDALSIADAYEMSRLVAA